MADLETNEEVTTDEGTEITEETENETDTSETESDIETDETETEETTLEDEIIEDLTAELEVTDENFNVSLLAVKVKSAIREVKRAKRYPSSYSDDTINSDLYNYYSNIRNIALYDYNQVGIEGQSASNENGVSRTYIDRKSLFVGVIPIAKI